MKSKIFRDAGGDPIKVGYDEGFGFLTLTCTETRLDEDGVVLMCFGDADQVEALAKRLLKGAKKLREARSHGEA